MSLPPLVEPAPELSIDEVRRYSRHLIIPDVAMDGQKRLKNAKVLCVGAGGLGSPALMYLAAAGVGTIGIAEFDTVDESNLQRQIIHGQSDIGRPKSESAAATVREINPYVNVVIHNTVLDNDNVFEIFEQYDLIVDGTDNFATRYMVNDAAVLLGKPYVWGSIYRFDGQASVFWADQGPCYRCLYPEPPPPGMVPSCAEGGVLGVLPGIVGSLQALEVLKLVLGRGEPMIGRLLVFDALQMKFRELRQRKDPDCPICGERPRIRELIDYEEFCGIPQAREVEKKMGVPTITVEGLKKLLDEGEDVLILDVREPHEWDIAHIEGATLIPLGRLPHEANRLDSAKDIAVLCRSGARSARATEFLLGAGFQKVRNIEGGILAWADRVDPSLPKY